MPRRKFFKFILSLISIILVLGSVLLLIGNSSIDKLPITKTKNQLRIIAMNVSADNVLPDYLEDNIIQTRPEIIVVIEWTGKNFDLIKFGKAGYRTVLNHPRKKVHGICILSKLNGISTVLEAPIKTPCTLPLGQFRFIWQDRYITLFAVHAPPPVPSCKGTTSDYLMAIANWVDHGKLSSNIGIGKKTDNLILAGDFNCLSFENGIEVLKSKQLNDSYSKYSFTAPTWKPFKVFPYIAKIDYIMFSDEFKSNATKRFNIENSDHLGLVTDLTF